MGISVYDIGLELYQLEYLNTPSKHIFYNHLQDFKHHFKDREIVNILSKDIKAYISLLWQRNNQPSTINRKLSTLRTIFKYAKDNSYIQRMPPLRSVKGPEIEIRCLGSQDIKRLIKSKIFQKNNLSVVIELLLNTGLRVNELLNLEPEHVLTSPKPYIKVIAKNSKNKKARIVPISDNTLTLLEKFFTLKPITYRQVYYFWDKLREEIGLNFRIHDLRHTFCSKLVEKGVDILTIKELAGHKSLTATERYLHINQDKLFNAIERLSNENYF